MVCSHTEIGWAHAFQTQHKVKRMGACIAQLYCTPAVPHRQALLRVGQGHVFGRGNQQLSPAVIRAIGRDNILLIASKAKLQQLEGRPLLADTGDVELDQQLTGLINILTGYNDYVMYRLGYEDDI